VAFWVYAHLYFIGTRSIVRLLGSALLGGLGALMVVMGIEGEQLHSCVVDCNA
jgi:hypothetical protein